MDPKIIDGIGNAYSDEILHDAKLSPFQWTRNLTDEEIERLFASAKHLLSAWVDRLLMQTGESFPERVTAFRPEMSVHGKFGKPCPVCQAPVQRIRYSERECNYCPRCQTNDASWPIARSHVCFETIGRKRSTNGRSSSKPSN